MQTGSECVFTANEAFFAVLEYASKLLGMPRPEGAMAIVRVDGSSRLAYDFVPCLDWNNPNDVTAYRAYADALHRIPHALHCLKEYGYRGDELACTLVRLSGSTFHWQLVFPRQPHTPRLVSGKAITSAPFGY